MVLLKRSAPQRPAKAIKIFVKRGDFGAVGVIGGEMRKIVLLHQVRRELSQVTGENQIGFALTSNTKPFQAAGNYPLHKTKGPLFAKRAVDERRSQHRNS